MKKVLLAVLFLGSVAHAQNKGWEGRGDVYSNLNQCSYSCSNACRGLVDDLKKRIDRVESDCGAGAPGQVDQSVFQDAYQYAYSASGLNLTSASAEAFANRITQQREPRAVLIFFNKAYTYAYSASGLNLTTSSAMEFSWKLSAQRDRSATLECYQKAYSFAYSASGMNKTSSAARAHAEQACRIQ